MELGFRISLSLCRVLGLNDLNYSTCILVVPNLEE